jgi:hypothetical protein
MKNEAIKDLFMYWNRLRGARPAPTRTEIEPADIRRHLADTFILERDARGESVFRLAGTRVCAIYGRELKNFSFSSLFGPHDLTLVKRLVKACYDEKIICVIGFEGRSTSGRSNLFETILLPLQGAQEGARLFGAIIPEEKPFWLGSDIILDNSITTVKVVDPDKELLSLKNRPSVNVPPLAPTSLILSSAHHLFQNGSAQSMSNGAKRVRHLTVISGGLENR